MVWYLLYLKKLNWNNLKYSKQGSRFGIKLKAKGESIHMIKADIETEVSPIIGNEEQSKEFIDSLIQDYDVDPQKIWDLNIFGRTLQSMVSDGMQNKIYRMPEEAQMKLQETLQKIVNEGSGGLICIILYIKGQCKSIVLLLKNFKILYPILHNKYYTAKILFLLSPKISLFFLFLVSFCCCLLFRCTTIFSPQNF